MSESKICVLGSANQDIFLKVKQWPKPGQTIEAHDHFQAFGGKVHRLTCIPHFIRELIRQSQGVILGQK